MGNQNMANLFAVYCIENGIDVSLVVWARIDDRDLPAAKDVCACAVKSECARVIGNNSANARRESRCSSVAEFQLAAKESTMCLASIICTRIPFSPQG